MYATEYKHELATIAAKLHLPHDLKAQISSFMTTEFDSRRNLGELDIIVDWDIALSKEQIENKDTLAACEEFLKENDLGKCLGL